MINEDYVSFEVAKLLKEKGFNEPIWTRYEDDNEVIFGYKYDWNNSPMGQTSAPTHQMALKWLREVHSLCICIYYLWPCGYEIDLYRIGKDTPISEFEAIREYGYDTYEDAVEAALKYVLENLI